VLRTFLGHFLEKWMPPLDSEGHVHVVKPCFQVWKSDLPGGKAKKPPKFHVSICFWSLALHIWVVLGDCNFRGENQGKIGNQGKIWKVDRIRSPMSYHEPNLEIRKALKIQLEVGAVHSLQALCTWDWRCTLARLPNFSLFLLEFAFHLGILIFYLFNMKSWCI